MLFNSFEFIFAFLPLVLVVYYSLEYFKLETIKLPFLFIASLIFYGWWLPKYLPLLLLSILLNYYFARNIASGPDQAKRKRLLIAAVTLNLMSLAYFKYANFFANTMNSAFSLNLDLPPVELPLGISFFTFQQIAYLVDVYWNSKNFEKSIIRHGFFINFFPQLIAGPIVHLKQMLPQFDQAEKKAYSLRLGLGLSVFIFGLFKKVALADTCAKYATPMFNAASQDIQLTLIEAWGGAVAYSLQLYYDFSGYSDMAIGLGLMFGIQLPVNFNSPYKSRNVIEFWRRWHITLSTFLRDYLYIPLGGNRNGTFHRYKNLFITMTLGGLWHGAGWTFVIWGALHGALLIINHAWQAVISRTPRFVMYWTSSSLVKFSSLMMTFLVVTICWVYFRSPSVEVAHKIIFAMFGENGISLPQQFQAVFQSWQPLLQNAGVRFEGLGLFGGGMQDGLLISALLLLIAMTMPNTQFYASLVESILSNRLTERKFATNLQGKALSISFGIALGIACTTSVLFMFSGVSEFLYFQF